jgi:hypothetical protein
MAAEITSLAQYNANALAHLMKVAPDDRVVYLAMRFIYRQFMEQTDATLNRHQIVIAHAANEVEFGFMAYKKLSADFFKSYPRYKPNMDAVAIVSICGEYTDQINKSRDDGFDNELISLACNILNEIKEFKLYKPRHADEYKPETLFLIHLFGWKNLHSIGSDIEHNRLKIHELYQDLINCVEPLLSLARMNTKIGQIVKQDATTIQIDIMQKYNRPATQAFKIV